MVSWSQARGHWSGYELMRARCRANAAGGWVRVRDAFGKRVPALTRLVRATVSGASGRKELCPVLISVHCIC